MVLLCGTKVRLVMSNKLGLLLVLQGNIRTLKACLSKNEVQLKWPMTSSTYFS